MGCRRTFETHAAHSGRAVIKRSIMGTIRQIMALLPSFRVVRLSCKQLMSAILLSLSCSLVNAESNPSFTADIDLSDDFQAEQVEKVLDAKDGLPTHTVVAGDTLWNVAKRLRPENMPMAEAMDTLYLYNREAFVKGDSTKLIEGSVVSFPQILAAKTAPQLMVSDDNQALIIPAIEVITETNIEVELSADKSVDMEPQPAKEVTQEVVKKIIDENQATGLKELEGPIVTDNVTPLVSGSSDSDSLVQLEIAKENLEIEKQESFSDLDSVIDKVEDSPIKTEPKTLFVEQFDAQDFSQLLSRVKQLPIDLWVFVVALLFAMVINRLRKLSKIKKAQQNSVDKTEKAIESVLDGPFAESADDDIFSDRSKAAVNMSQSKAEELESEEVINLPGVEALEAQLLEDANGQQSQANSFLSVDFEDDTLDIDPLQIKLDMASLCIEMGDIESAQAILEEIIGEADKQGKAKAREILESIET
jgi:FimV-like protein